MYEEIVNLLRNGALEQLRSACPELTRSAAIRLLDLHLHPHTYAMPILDTDREVSVVAWSRGESTIDDACQLLQFEATHTTRGMARVLLRTHTNRGGIGRVVVHARNKAQTARVLALFEELGVDQDVRIWLSWRRYMDAWVALAERSLSEDLALDRRFFPEHLAALRALQGLDERPAAARGNVHVPGGDDNWNKVVRGFFCGLQTLDHRFSLDAQVLWRAIDSATTAGAVDRLSDDVKHYQFGDALAPSFLADLGSSTFVKADTHVMDVSAAAEGIDGKASAQRSIEFVRELSSATGLSPRGIDKLIYFACSGKFYLAGLQPVQAEAGRAKASLLQALRTRRFGVI